MKREIKFKAKRLDGKGWVEGSFVVMKIPALSKTTLGIVAEGGATLHEVDPSTICQFTGLKDCEGKEIWEGDIVHDSYDRLCIDNLYEVVYIEEEGTFAFKSLDKVGNYEPFVNLFEVYVVGNKFDKED